MKGRDRDICSRCGAVGDSYFTRCAGGKTILSNPDHEMYPFFEYRHDEGKQIIGTLTIETAKRKLERKTRVYVQKISLSKRGEDLFCQECKGKGGVS